MFNIHDVYAVFGGTFDPIHIGHLNLAKSVATQIGLAKIFLMPNNIPPHRSQPKASIRQRLTMLKLAIKNIELFDIEMQELIYKSPSYTINTLVELRKIWGQHKPIAFIIGQDSLLDIFSWYEGCNILNYCHLLVGKRLEYLQIQEMQIKQWLLKYQTLDIKKIYQQPYGYIYFIDNMPICISSTEIRRRKFYKQTCYKLLPDTVSNFIDEEKLYSNNLDSVFCNR